MKMVLIGFVTLVLLFVVAFVMTGGDFVIYKFWAPKMENAKRQVFENTAGYVQGKVSYLTTLRFQYQSAVGDQKAALRSLILSESATVDNTQLPIDLQQFVSELKVSGQ